MREGTSGKNLDKFIKAGPASNFRYLLFLLYSDICSFFWRLAKIRKQMLIQSK